MKKPFKKILKTTAILYLSTLHIARKRGFCIKQNTRKLYGYMNKYQGERCFIIGNGPSLNAADLDTLVNEYTFGCNMIYKIFDQTNWRPTFHCSIDKICASALANEYKEKIASTFFTNHSIYKSLEDKPDDTIYVQNYYKDPYQVSPRFLSYYHPSNATVTSFMIELAIFMGFKEIYLLGIDCTNVFKDNGHFTGNYVSQDLKEKDIARIYEELSAADRNIDSAAQYSIDKSLYAYAKLKEFAKSKDVKIYNATRGGNLEIYERSRFDSIVKK